MTLEIKPGWTRYQSRKIVDAAPIVEVSEVKTDPPLLIKAVDMHTGEEMDHLDLGPYRDIHFQPGVFGDVEVMQQPEAFFARGLPVKGDMLVRYSDGYLSWSPRKAFEEGYENT